MTERLRVLLVDDDDADRLAVRRALDEGELPVEVFEAHCLAEAIALLERERCDCVLMDNALPDRGGADALEEIRRARTAVPVIILTAQGSEQLAVDLMKAGAADYFSKSRISSDSLTRSIRNAVRL